ncbi:MAG: type II secretion system protein, partial [Verrucomicrobiota bacterium]
LVMTSQAGNNTMRRFKNHNGFTLVELLAVIIIIGLLIAVSIPSLARITQANALSNATRQFSDQVAMARTYALVNAQNVYLVVAYSDNNCYTAYGFCVSAVNQLANNLNVDPLSTVTYIDAVQHLPAGAIFTDQISNIATANVPFPTNGAPRLNVWCVQFNQYGQCAPLRSISAVGTPACQTPLTCPPQLSLTQGFVTTGATPTPTGTYPGTNRITINPITGKAIVNKS